MSSCRIKHKRVVWAAVLALGGCASGGGGATAPDAASGGVEPGDASAEGAAVDATGADSHGADGASGQEGGCDAAGDASSCDAGVPAALAITATAGWQIYAGGTYHYGPSILIDTDSSIHMWTCSPGTGGAWDFVRYHHSTDGGHTWTPDVVALQPTAGSLDAYSTCDPGAVKIGSYFYVGYTSTTNANGTANNVFIARAASPTGPFDKWNGTGWGGNPQPIVSYAGDPSYYGYGEPSLVLMGKRIYVYYSDDEAAQFTNVATSDDATIDDWPAHLVDHGHAIVRDHAAQDSADVKYVDARSVFVAVTTCDRFSPNASLLVYQSPDGLTFTREPYLGARAQIGAHNAGISGDLAGHLQISNANFVAYAYQPAGNGWGDWPTFLDPVAIGSAQPGSAVAGEVSSIVGSNDWSWSGPRAWDGDPSTIFSSNQDSVAASSEWAWVDVGQARTIDGVTLVPRAMGYGFPVDFSFQTSDDASAWTDVPGQSYTAHPSPGSSPVVISFSSPVVARYLRIDATKLGPDDHGNFYLQLAEIRPSTP